jgi:hypothetical protein
VRHCDPLTIECLQDGRASLTAASSNGHAEVVQLLLAAPNIDANLADKVIAPLPWAAPLPGVPQVLKISTAREGCLQGRGVRKYWQPYHGHLGTDIVV